MNHHIFEPERKSFRGRIYSVNKSMKLSKSEIICNQISNTSSMFKQEIENFNIAHVYRAKCKIFPLKLFKKIKKIIRKFNFIKFKNSFKIQNTENIGKTREVSFNIEESKLFSRNSNKIIFKKFIFLKNYIGKRYYNMLTTKNNYQILIFLYKKYSFLQNKIIKEELYKYSVNTHKIFRLQALSNLRKIKFLIEKEYREIEMQNPPNSLNFNRNFFTALNGRYIPSFQSQISQSIETINKLFQNRILTTYNQIEINKDINANGNKGFHNLIVTSISDHLGASSKYIQEDNSFKPVISNIESKKEISSNEIKLNKINKVEKLQRYSPKDKNNSLTNLVHYDKILQNESPNRNLEQNPKNTSLISNEKKNLAQLEEENWDQFKSFTDLNFQKPEEKSNHSISVGGSAKESNDNKGKSINQENEKEDEIEENSESEESLNLGLANLINNYNVELLKIKTKNNLKSSDSGESSSINQSPVTSLSINKIKGPFLDNIDEIEIKSFISHK